jgi:hypothetical protein
MKLTDGAKFVESILLLVYVRIMANSVRAKMKTNSNDQSERWQDSWKKQREMKVSKVMMYQSKTRQDYEHDALMAQKSKSGKQLTFVSIL